MGFNSAFKGLNKREVTHCSCICTVTYTGCSGGKVNIFGGDSIGHSKKKLYEHVSNYKWLQKHGCFNIQIQKQCKW